MKNLQQHQHFSHHHPLVPLGLDEGEELNCNGCDSQIQEPFHGCISCNYFLHDTCLNTPRFLQHPSHPHPLTLLPTPTYPTPSFDCDACGSQDKSFSFSCAQCECDLHLQCTSLPHTLRIRNKHYHDLKLIFRSPYANGTDVVTFLCDVCDKEVNLNHWRYYCAGCDFGVHLYCAAPPKTGGSGGESGGGGKQKQQNVAKNGNEQAAARLRVEEADFQNSVYERQRKMKEQDVANRLVLQALDNAGDYVGPSHTKYYYY